MRPCSRTYARAAMAKACTTFCSTRSTATPSAWIPAITPNTWSTMRGARPSESSSDRHHLLLPARERARELSPPLAQDRKRRVDALEALAAHPPRRRRVAADLEVLLDGHRREEAATFGNERDAPAAELVRGHRRQIVAVEASGSGPDRQQPGDRVDERRLPAPFGPTTVTSSRGRTPSETSRTATASP